MRYVFFIKRIIQSVILTLVIFTTAYIYKNDVNIVEIFLSDNLPNYIKNNHTDALFKLNPDEPVWASELLLEANELSENDGIYINSSGSDEGNNKGNMFIDRENGDKNGIVENSNVNNEEEVNGFNGEIEREGAGGGAGRINTADKNVEQKEDEETNAAVPVRIEINDVLLGNAKIVGLTEGIFQPETDHENTDNHNFDTALTDFSLDKLRDIMYLREKFYIVDPRTAMTPELFNADKFMNTNLKLNESEGPKILIFHTHSQEMFTNSQSINEGIIAVGDALTDALNNKYGIKTIHNTSSFDIVDGKSQILGAYERMEPVIMNILKENPSIDMVIDLHRDGLPEGAGKQTVNINGKQTAQIMFFNGLTRLMENGTLEELNYLPNNYLDTNLALSFNMQLTASSIYPGFTKKIYLNAYRYSLHMLPKSLFVEVGSQYNTMEEAINTAEPLADIIAQVVGKNSN